MLDHAAIYDALYLLAAADGREDALFGDCQPLAREAFSRSLIGDEFPIIWFEVPLAGAPRFDLHLAASRSALVPGAEFAPGAGGGYEGLFRWYAEEEPGGAGLAFAYDVSEGRIDAPAVHVNVNGAPLSSMDRFFDLSAGGDAAERYRAFKTRLPRGWRVWYAGFHPGRPSTPVRVDCFVDDRLKAAYASAPSLFEAHLRECGFTAASAALRNLAGLVTASPFALELQFDVLPDGSVGPTIGVSAGFGTIPTSELRTLFAEGGGAATLIAQIERRGLADARWRLISHASFAKLVETGDGPLVLLCTPTFVKLRMRDGKPLDAKAYLQASAHGPKTPSPSADTDPSSLAR